MTFSQTKLLTILHGQNGVKIIYEGAVAVRTLPSLRIDISFYVELNESKTLEVKGSPKCQPLYLIADYRRSKNTYVVARKSRGC